MKVGLTTPRMETSSIWRHRLCCGVDDTQMLVDAVVAKRVKQSIAPVSFGERTIKGYDHPLQVFAVERSEVAIRYPDCGWRLP